MDDSMWRMSFAASAAWQSSFATGALICTQPLQGSEDRLCNIGLPSKLCGGRLLCSGARLNGKRLAVARRLDDRPTHSLLTGLS
jgi:hypothetical protein